MVEPRIIAVDPAELEALLPALARLMQACVEAGASINFVRPFSVKDSEAFWRQKVLPGVQAGTRLLWVAAEAADSASPATAADSVLGSVQLDLDTPPNQPHRGEVAKLMVHPQARRRGLGRALMAALEVEARVRGRTLLTLDTRSGDAAEPLYTGLGYRTVGQIPGFCLDPQGSGRLDATTIMYKPLT